jgi:hypothetical protein
MECHMKKLLLAAGLLVAGYVSTASPAMADVDVNVGIGVPGVGYGYPGPEYDYYDYRAGPDYRFREGYGWYRPVYRPGFGRLSCGEARRLVRRSGYRNVAARDCSGRTYTFNATRNGRVVVIYVNSRNGRVWRG